MGNDTLKQSGRLKTFLRILEDTFKTKDNYVQVDFDMLGVAKDFLMENNEIEKVEYLNYLISEKKYPLFKNRQYYFSVRTPEKYDNCDSLLSPEFFYLEEFGYGVSVREIFAKSFPLLIHKVCLLWKCAKEIPERMQSFIEILDKTGKESDGLSVFVDFDILKNAQDFLKENGETEKANCLEYLIENQKRPIKFDYTPYTFGLGEKNRCYYIPANLFSLIDGNTGRISEKSFSEIIYKSCVLWECATEIRDCHGK